MKVTFEISNLSEVEKLLATLKALEFENIKVVPEKNSQAFITKGDKKINPRDLFGIWKKKPRTLEQIRVKSWKRNWSL